MPLKRYCGALIFSLLLSPHTSIADSLSLKENEIRSFVKKNKENQLNFLEKLVNVNSGTENIAGVQEVGELLRPKFEKLGFKTHWENEPEDMHRAGTLIAEHPGNSGKRLLLIGHLDTVFSQSLRAKEGRRPRRVVPDRPRFTESARRDV